MIAMQYTIRLAGDFGGDRIQSRVDARAALFDGLDGLIHKSFLFNESEAIYAPFYVWRDAEAARRFLTGDLFRDLVDTFGRPRVRSWNVIAYGGCTRRGNAAVAVKEADSVDAGEDLATLAAREGSRHELAMCTPGLCCHVVGIDSDRWELMRYSVWRDPHQIANCDADMVENYQVLHVSDGGRGS